MVTQSCASDAACGLQQTFTGGEASSCGSAACYAEVQFVINSQTTNPLTLGNALYLAFTTSQFQAGPRLGSPLEARTGRLLGLSPAMQAAFNARASTLLLPCTQPDKAQFAI